MVQGAISYRTKTELPILDSNSILEPVADTSHCNLYEMLEFTEEKGINMLCIPAHITYSHTCKNFIKTNPTEKIGRLQFASLLAEGSAKAGVASNAISGHCDKTLYIFLNIKIM